MAGGRTLGTVSSSGMGNLRSWFFLCSLVCLLTFPSIVESQAVTGVSISPGGAYTWSNGITRVSWDAPQTAVDSYIVTASPLDYSTNFAGTEAADFIASPGTSSNSISYSGAGYLHISFSGSSWQTPATGRGNSAYALRKVPDGATVEVNYVNCPSPPGGASVGACGVVVYNAGTSTPLFTWMVAVSSSGK